MNVHAPVAPVAVARALQRSSHRPSCPASTGQERGTKKAVRSLVRQILAIGTVEDVCSKRPVPPPPGQFTLSIRNMSLLARLSR